MSDHTREALNGRALIEAERRRQIEAEGYTLDHDMEHGSSALRIAARCYQRGSIDHWPWAAEFWKPKDRLSDLVRAGALFLAAREVQEAIHGPVGYSDGEMDRCAFDIDGILESPTVAAHVAVVVADKDVENERLREAITTIEAAWSVCDDDRQAGWDERDVALARLGAIAALAEEWDVEGIACSCGHQIGGDHNSGGCYAVITYSPLVRCECALTDDQLESDIAATALRAILAGSAGAIAKHEQEVRAGVWDEGVTAGFTDATRTLPTILESNPYRADGLTEGQAET